MPDVFFAFQMSMILYRWKTSKSKMAIKWLLFYLPPFIRESVIKSYVIFGYLLRKCEEHVIAQCDEASHWCTFIRALYHFVDINHGSECEPARYWLF